MEKEQCSKHKIQAAGKSKRDAGELQCPVADSCCLLLHINLGRHNTVPPGVCSEEGAFDACLSERAAVHKQLPRHGWVREHEIWAVLSAP